MSQEPQEICCTRLFLLATLGVGSLCHANLRYSSWLSTVVYGILLAQTAITKLCTALGEFLSQ